VIPTQAGRVAVMLALASVVHAQEATEADAELSEVTVTGSRLRVTSGMETPNPVTVLTTEELSLTSPGSLVDALAELPQFSGSNTTANPGGFFNNPTTGALSLRGLQSKRTLTLLNSRRVVGSTANSGPDINLFPESVLRSVETVTGGATAAYGTDAVSGAVNFILDTNFTGYKASAQIGQNYNKDNRNYELSATGGWSLGERGHLILSVEKQHQDAVIGRDGYDWYRAAGILGNPDVANRGRTPGNPVGLPYENIVSTTASYDGIIAFSGAAASLGTWVVDSSGNAVPLVRGAYVSPAAPNTVNFSNGGNGGATGTDRPQLQPETGRQNVFAYADYDVSDALNVFGQLIYGETSLRSVGNEGAFSGQRNFVIFSGNPYLPANIQTLMTANNVASVNVGRIGFSDDMAANAWNISDTSMLSATAGFKYNVNSTGFFQDWQVDGYYQRGEVESVNNQEGGIRIDRMYMAVDAVRDTNGNVVCNVTRVSGRFPECVPFNIFGRGRASAAAVDWVTGFDPGVQVSTNGWLPNGESIPYSYVGGTGKKRLLDLTQDVAELSANGKLSEGFGAGPVLMALGYAWRLEDFLQRVQAPQGNPAASPDVFPVLCSDTAAATSATRAAACTAQVVSGMRPATPIGLRGIATPDATNYTELQFSKVHFARGKYSVREAFVEFSVPLLKDLPLIAQLDTNLAARWASYSGSGSIWSWKGGLEWRTNDQIRIRGTISQDVRAANMAERFDRTGGAGNVCDYLESALCSSSAPPLSAQYGINVLTEGVPTLKPEKARTLTAGIVYQPSWLDGLQASVDWYNVEIKNNINLLGAAAIMQNCYERNDPEACALIERNGNPSSVVPGLNRISLINDRYLNINAVAARGIDMEVTYRTDINLFGGGEILTTRALGSYLLRNISINSLGVARHLEGTLGLPDWTGQVSTSYQRGPLSANVQVRFESDVIISDLNNIFRSNFNGGAVRYDVLDNRIGFRAIVDARLGYRFDVRGTKLNAFLSVNNVLNRDPAALLAAPDTGFYQRVGNGVTGDLLGRRYTLGVNMEF
jgi:iron complex outermembrane recepter protein